MSATLIPIGKAPTVNWTRVLRLEDIPLGGMAEGKAGDEAALFVRDGDGVRAFQAKCPHYGAPLAKGIITEGIRGLSSLSFPIEDAIANQTRLSWLKLRSGSRIDRISFRYTDVHGEGPIQSHGGDGGSDQC